MKTAVSQLDKPVFSVVSSPYDSFFLKVRESTVSEKQNEEILVGVKTKTGSKGDRNWFRFKPFLGSVH